MRLTPAALAIRFRTRHIERENRRLEDAVRARTRELGLQKELVERQKVEIEALLRQAQEASPSRANSWPI